MGKNNKHKKNEKSEKAKVKLKGGKTKFLPKGQNVTDINFKIKPIVLKEQLKEHSQHDLLTRRNLNIKDLLSRLKHYNVKIKAEGCEGLIELIGSHGSDCLGQNLAEIFQNLSQLFLDLERKVRQKAVKLLSVILELVPVEEIAPFFSIIISYTTCAMTNISRDIQEDSLLIFDSLIKFTPSLIALWFDKVFTNFLSLISKLRNEFLPNRTLSLNLNSKLTSVKWRIKVLSRLEDILKIVIDDKNQMRGQGPSSGNHQIIVTDNLHTITIPYRQTVDKCTLDFFTENHLQDEGTQYQKYIDELMPLLHETWSEVVPSIVNDSMVVSPDTVNILKNILVIVDLLWQLLDTDERFDYRQKKQLLYTKESQNLLNSIITYFPYHQKAISNTQRGDTNNDPRCIRENLLISLIFCRMHRHLSSKTQFEHVHLIIKYLNECLLEAKNFSPESTTCIFRVLATILLDNNWINHNVLAIEELLSNVIQFQSETRHAIGDDLFQLLCDSINKFDLNFKCLNEFLHRLPSRLYKEKTISEKIINVLSALIRKNNQIFRNSLLDNQENILRNIDQLHIRNSENEGQSIMKIVGLFYYAKLNRNHLDIFAKFLQENPHSKASTYVKNLLQCANYYD